MIMKGLDFSAQLQNWILFRTVINAKLNFCYSREIPGTLTKGKYRSSNEFTSGYDIHDMSGGFESNSEVPSWTMGDEDNELELSTTAEEYFSSVNIVESILNDVIDKALQSGELSDSSKVCIPKFFFFKFYFEHWNTKWIFIFSVWRFHPIGYGDQTKRRGSSQLALSHAFVLRRLRFHKDALLSEHAAQRNSNQRKNISLFRRDDRRYFQREK